MEFKIKNSEEANEIKFVSLEQATNGDVHLLIGDNYVLTLNSEERRIDLVDYCCGDAVGMDVDEEGYCPVYQGDRKLKPGKR